MHCEKSHAYAPDGFWPLVVCIGYFLHTTMMCSGKFCSNFHRVFLKNCDLVPFDLILPIQRLALICCVMLSPAYRLYTVVPRLVKFVDMLTNWYVRTNRRRLKVWLSHVSPSV